MSKGQRFANAAGRAIASGSGHLGALGIGLILACVAAYIASTIGTSQLNDVPRLALAHNDETLLRFTDQFAAGFVIIGAALLTIVVGVYARKRAVVHIAGGLLTAGNSLLSDLTSNRVNPNEMADRALQWSSDVERLLGDVDSAANPLFTLAGSLRVQDRSVGATSSEVEEFLDRRTAQLATILVNVL